MAKVSIFSMCLLMMFVAGCWDKVEHTYDCEVSSNGSDAAAADGDADTDADSDADADADTSEGKGQGTRPAEWEDFGGPCTTHDDCTGYPNARCVDNSILGVINAPGGYCTACCNKAGDFCADGVQCIGLDDVYLICAASCTGNDACREEEGWECRKIPPYLDTSAFPGNFCLPNDENIESDTDATSLPLDCDWPWLD